MCAVFSSDILLFFLKVMCYAAVGNEKANITKLVARQHAAKKTGRPPTVNCQMRVKPISPLALNGRTTLNTHVLSKLLHYNVCIT